MKKNPRGHPIQQYRLEEKNTHWKTWPTTEYYGANTYTNQGFFAWPVHFNVYTADRLEKLWPQLLHQLISSTSRSTSLRMTLWLEWAPVNSQRHKNKQSNLNRKDSSDHTSPKEPTRFFLRWCSTSFSGVEFFTET